MPKELLLLRHAKSSWADAQLADFARPLNTRGEHDAPLVGEWLLQTQRVPDVLLSSTAARASRTAELVARAIGFTGDVDYRGELYLASPETYVRTLRTVPDDVQRVLVIGHNPGLEQLVSLLTGFPTSMPTAGLAEIHLPISAWSELPLARCGELATIWRPETPET